MAHVEKDFWVTEVLRGIARCSADTGVSAVFKGGTSLSKAFGLIRRFSEDVDVIVIAPGHSTGQDNRCPSLAGCQVGHSASRCRTTVEQRNVPNTGPINSSRTGVQISEVDSRRFASHANVRENHWWLFYMSSRRCTSQTSSQGVASEPDILCLPRTVAVTVFGPWTRFYCD